MCRAQGVGRRHERLCTEGVRSASPGLRTTPRPQASAGSRRRSARAAGEVRWQQGRRGGGADATVGGFEGSKRSSNSSNRLWRQHVEAFHHAKQDEVIMQADPRLVQSGFGTS